MTCLEDARHAIFVIRFGLLLIAVKAAGVIDQFAIVPFVIPLGRERLCKDGIDLRRETMQRAPQPDIEEVHQVRIRNGIIVRRIGHYSIIFV